MTFNVEMPSKNFDFYDLFGLFEFIALEADITSLTKTSVRGNGVYDGLQTSVIVSGSNINSDASRGTVDRIAFKLGGEKIVFKNLDLSLAALDGAIVREDDGDNTALEQFLMRQDWNVKFKSGDDVFLQDSFFGDGAEFHPRGDDTFRLGGGNDDVFLGKGDDRAWGVAGNDFIRGHDGKDEIYGGKGRDVLDGGANRDLLIGGSSNDEIYGGGGGDEIHGGRQKDDLTGGGGADVFVFRTGDGKDVIRDFDANNNNEEIDLSAVKAIRNWNDLKNNHMTADESDVLIDDNNGLVIRLNDVNFADLNKTDFIF